MQPDEFYVSRAFGDTHRITDEPQDHDDNRREPMQEDGQPTVPEIGITPSHGPLFCRSTMGAACGGAPVHRASIRAEAPAVALMTQIQYTAANDCIGLATRIAAG